MKSKFLPSMFAALTLAFFAAGTALAEEQKIVGTITAIEVSAQGTEGLASIKDGETGAQVDVVVTDELTLDKFKDKRIVAGDEIRCKYAVENGKKISKLLRKTAGC